MREWSLTPSDPLYLTLAADMRLSTPNYVNDHIWELEIDTGEPASLSLRTTFGLRARSMRIFPRFTEAGKAIASPSKFIEQITVQNFYPNFISLAFSPLNGLLVSYEIRVPHSNAICGRFFVTNQLPTRRDIRLEVCSVLVPIEGHAMAHTQLQLVNVLIGQTSELVPTLFLTGGPQPGPGPQPSLMVDLTLDPGETRQLTWAQAAAENHQGSFDQARLIAAQPWEAERARIEMVNTRDTLKIHTPDSDWNAALAFSQSAALGSFFPASEHLPNPTFMQARQPDHGYSRKGDGSDHPASWSGQTPLDAYHLSSVLAASPELAKGLLENFLSMQDREGNIDGKPGLGGQRGRHIAMPILSALAWKVYEANKDENFLAEIFPKLLAFFWAWFSPFNDRNRDGIPEWMYPMQTGYEDNPLFDAWHPWSKGVDITLVHSPALAALLYREAGTLAKMAAHVGRQDAVKLLERQAEKIKSALEKNWNPRKSLYTYSDRDTGLSLPGKPIGRLKGPGMLKPQKEFKQPVRLLIQVQTKSPGAKRPHVVVGEYVTKGESEVIIESQFHWHNNGLVATSQNVHTRIGRIQVKNIDPADKVIVRTVDYTSEDHTLLMPLWAGIPDMDRAQEMIEHTLLDADRFDQPFGIPACPQLSNDQSAPVCMSVHLPWNLLIGEGLLAYGFRDEAARLLARMIAAVTQNLKQKSAFYQRYHAQTGQGLGERNALNGLIPVGLFLQTLGVQVISDTKVRLEGTNPFPWPVTIQYRGLKIVRALEHTRITFQNGKSIQVDDPAACIVSL